MIAAGIDFPSGTKGLQKSNGNAGCRKETRQRGERRNSPPAFAGYPYFVFSLLVGSFVGSLLVGSLPMGSVPFAAFSLPVAVPLF
jgi:hypothetical protein